MKCFLLLWEHVRPAVCFGGPAVKHALHCIRATFVLTMKVCFIPNCAPLALQLGIALGFLVPPMLVPNVEDVDELTQHIRVLLYISAGVATALFLLVIIGKTCSGRRVGGEGRGRGVARKSDWLASPSGHHASSGSRS